MIALRAVVFLSVMAFFSMFVIQTVSVCKSIDGGRLLSGGKMILGGVALPKTAQQIIDSSGLSSVSGPVEINETSLSWLDPDRYERELGE